MPEDSKKNQDKKKNDPKEQRKPRNARNQASKVDKRTEKTEEPRSAPKVTVPQKPPVYEDPGPEFYKNLKRETEEILKITEEEQSKYKKKEIQSNWSKYEMPIESYDDIEEHDVGADYEKLIQAPLSIGGHFQFKHEKSWDANTGPSLYDKYFEINMDNLSLAVSTIPFYERNGVDESLFSENDMLSMNNRATKYKQKYFNDKSYSTAETEAQDKILNSLKEGLSKKPVEIEEGEEEDNLEPHIEETPKSTEEDSSVVKDDISLDFKFEKTDNTSPMNTIEVKEKSVESNKSSAKSIDDVDELILEKTTNVKQELTAEKIVEPPIVEKIVEPPVVVKEAESKKINEPMKNQPTSKSTETQSKVTPVEVKKNPVIESPEDLEKWLDDFLDG